MLGSDVLQHFLGETLLRPRVDAAAEEHLRHVPLAGAALELGDALVGRPISAIGERSMPSGVVLNIGAMPSTVARVAAGESVACR